MSAVPPWAALPAAILLISAGLLAVLGALGLLRLPTFFERMHPPTMGTTLGTGCVLIASMLVSWREVLRIGVPSTLSQMIGPVSMAVVIGLLAPHGHAVVAGFGVAQRIESLALMVLMALGSSISPFVGQNWGAGRHGRIREALLVGYRFSIQTS